MGRYQDQISCLRPAEARTTGYQWGSGFALELAASNLSLTAPNCNPEADSGIKEVHLRWEKLTELEERMTKSRIS